MKQGETYQWECEVIQDLIPSYVDEICSDRSREVVEEHMLTCAECKKLVAQYRATGFSSDALEKKELNGFKKIRQHMQRQRLVSGVLAALLAILGLRAFWGGGHSHMSWIVYDVLLVLSLFGVYHMGAKHDGRVPAQRADHLLAAGSGLVMLLSIGALCLSLAQAMAGKRVLGVAPEHAGPMLAGIWAFFFAVQFVIFFVLWRRQKKLSVENRPQLCICVTSMFLLLVYVEALHRLDSIDTVIHAFAGMSATVFVIGTVGTRVCHKLSS